MTDFVTNREFATAKNNDIKSESLIPELMIEDSLQNKIGDTI